ncbi:MULTISPECIES: hypothetical protein [Haloferax]|uniref:Uncharacterized protein n=1 Tax=Haloferax mediterranei (strain ATCC 33500 / DSM 1411 / JCM 8866 / NBRC 14739 / NCIMB 2177 / R-4) TaxID=523841 RepID=M0ILE8_HALMT|nr:hypothetical protein [Haloferax mediterranei]ELZ97555.1 hypothetical protein C439_16603 [Haloferax mediterranei ATCC 33500]MDX5989652.1 hypothetical protein [Haloferax mediterranei ATCC 33500]
MDDADALVAAIAEAGDCLEEIDEEIEGTNRLAFVFKTPDGERLDDDAFFQRACEHERVRERIADFLW